MMRALIGGLCFALSAPLIGVFLSLKRLSLAGDAMSHALLPGIGFAFLIFGASVPALFLGGVVSGVVTAAILTWVLDSSTQVNDRKLMSVLSLLTAVGVLMITARTGANDLHQILFGSVLTVDSVEVFILAGVLIVTFLSVLFFGKHFVFETVDTESFHRLHPQARWVKFSLFFLTSLVLSAGVSTMGSLLVIGLLALPAAAAIEHVGHWKKVIFVAVGISAASMYLGLVLSYHLDLPPGPLVVTSSGIFFLASTLLAKLRK